MEELAFKTKNSCNNSMCYWFYIVIIAGLALLFGHLIMFLWNVSIGAIFNLPDLTFWQAIALVILCRILFGNDISSSSSSSSNNCNRKRKKSCCEEVKEEENEIDEMPANDKEIENLEPA